MYHFMQVYTKFGKIEVDKNLEKSLKTHFEKFY